MRLRKELKNSIFATKTIKSLPRIDGEKVDKVLFTNLVKAIKNSLYITDCKEYPIDVVAHNAAFYVYKLITRSN